MFLEINSDVVVVDFGVRDHYLYSEHQSWELGRVLRRVTDNSGCHARGFTTVVGHDLNMGIGFPIPEQTVI